MTNDNYDTAMKIFDSSMPNDIPGTLRPNTTQESPVQRTLPTVNNFGADAIIAKAVKSADSSNFNALFKGAWEELGLYPSQSEADTAFCNQLAYWTNCNVNLMDAIFRRSGLMRDKWDEVHEADTYGRQTIKKAIDDVIHYRVQSAAAINNRTSVRPNDYTDVGNAKIFTEVFKNSIVYSPSCGYLVWTGQYFLENNLGAIAFVIDLSERMLQESLSALSTARTELAIAESLQDANRIRQAKHDEKLAKEYHNHALRTREAPRIMRMLELAKPALHVELDKLDADPFVLNTPGGIVDLRTGMMYPHTSGKLCTKITAISPDTVGAQMWYDFLKIITCGDKDMEDFLQMMMGMSAVGKVFMETVITAFGDGSNGKSTFFGSVNTVLGTYGGEIKPETLTTSRNNKSAEIMTLKGKRLIIAAELEEGENLSSSMLKRLASVDKITGERKYRDPESFVPSHSLVLFTNHLPKVASTDNGTWRRITAVRFNATIQGQADIKNYSDVLVAKAGGAIMDWVIKGAVKFIQNNCKLIIPLSVIDITNRYRYDNDQMRSFIADCCECDQTKRCKGGILYSAYRKWAENNGEFPRCKRDFTNELEKSGFNSHRQRDGVYWSGISIATQP